MLRFGVRQRIAVLILLFAATCDNTAAAPATAALDYGPHAVGFRFLTELDHSRAVLPRTTFDGVQTTGETAMAVDIGVWYPAETPVSQARMTAEAYKTLRSPQTRDAVIADFSRMAAFAGMTISTDEALEALTRPTHAVRDALPAPGRFPLVISGAYHGTGWMWAEYLASHGYVVVAAPSSARTATLEASQPEIALEIQTRNLEFLFAYARQQPFVDAGRLGVIGVNFDGMAALVFEMRNMRADAIVSLDGYEAKAGNVATLRGTPFFDPARLRAPYLLFVQDERDPPPALAHDKTIWNALRYATRYWYVLRDFNHVRLISDVGNASSQSPEQAAGHVFILGTMRLALDAYVKRDREAIAALAKRQLDNGLPSTLLKTADRATALPPAPTAEEFEQLVMSGSIDRAANVYRESKAANPDLRLFDESTIGLYAFRYGQRKLVKEALAVRKLAAEAFPESAMAAYQLGIAAVDAGSIPEARFAFERALALIASERSGAALSPVRRDELRRDIERRMTSLSGR